MLKWKDDKVYHARFDSLDELVSLTENDPQHTGWLLGEGPEWVGVGSLSEAVSLAKEGWPEQLDRALTVADEAVAKVEREHTMPAFVPEHGVAGCEVDVARFLDGTPENMIDYPLTEIVKAGRVITLCVGISASAAIEPDSFIRRGHAVTALALALSRLGYSTEIWTDWSMSGCANGGSVAVRTLIKGASDAVDAERLLYALAHPSMLRMFHFSGARLLFGQSFLGRAWSNMGYPAQPTENLPEGTIYTPSLHSDRDIPDADEQLVAWLKELGIVED